jgi:hypothetical protein
MRNKFKPFFLQWRGKKGVSALSTLLLLISITIITITVSAALIIEAETFDPKIDTFGTSPIYDVVKFSISADAENVTLNMVFRSAINPPDTTDGLSGYIDMDVDQNSGTGSMSHVDTYSQCLPASNLGMEYYVDIATYSG